MNDITGGSRPACVWITTTDASGRQRLEARWIVPADIAAATHAA